MGRWEWGSLSEECRVQSEEQPSGRRFHSEASAWQMVSFAVIRIMDKKSLFGLMISCSMRRINNRNRGKPALYLVLYKFIS